MAGFIVLPDGRAYAASNWGYDRVIGCIAQVVAEQDQGRALSEWLLEQRSMVRGSGLGSVDVRELTPSNRSLVLDAVWQAFERAAARGPAEWCEPSFFPSWLERFRDLVGMLESIDRGEPPQAFNPHMNDVIPPSGRRAGPGWGEAE